MQRAKQVPTGGNWKNSLGMEAPIVHKCTREFSDAFFTAEKFFPSKGAVMQRAEQVSTSGNWKIPRVGTGKTVSE